MASISIKSAKELYGGATELETAKNMAEAGRFSKIYKYANDYGNRKTHTDYKQIRGDSDEQEFLHSRNVHNIVLVYDAEQTGEVKHQAQRQAGAADKAIKGNRPWWRFW